MKIIIIIIAMLHNLYTVDYRYIAAEYNMVLTTIRKEESYNLVHTIDCERTSYT